MLVFFINYFPFNKINGIVRYQEGLQPTNFKKTKRINIYVKSPVEHITESCNGDILIPFDLAVGGNPLERDEMLSCFLDEVISKIDAQEKILFHINWMNHTPWIYTQRKHTPQAKFLLTKHCVAWREMILSNYRMYYRIQRNIEQKGTLPFPVKKVLSEELYYFSFADKIITVTDDAKHLLVDKYGITRQKVVKIYNGCGSRPNIRKGRKKEEFGFSATDKILLYVGTISQLKGLMALLQIVSEVIKQQENIRLIICGSGEYEQLFESLPHELLGKITIAGQKSSSEILELVGITDLAILPSMVEQCSFAALELITTGVPTLIGNTKGVREIIPVSMRKYAIKFLHKEDGLKIKLKDATKIIINFLNNTSLSEEYAKETKLRVDSIFNKEKMYRSTYRLYNQMMLNIDNTEKEGEPPLVSIVMPCYNCEKYIKEAIDSVLRQTYKNWELIIIDDGSEEECHSLLNKYNDVRIKFIQNLSNKGIVYSIRRGIHEAKGEYVARFDADDIMMPTRIATQVSFLQRHPEYSMVGSNHYWSVGNDYPIGYTIYPEKPEEINFYRFFQNPFSHPTVMIRSRIFDELNYESKYEYCEDYALWMKVCKKMQTYNIQEGLVIYRTHKGNISRKHNKQQQRSLLKLIFDELNEHEIYLTNKEELILTAIHLREYKYLRESNKETLLSLLNKVNFAVKHPLNEDEINDFVFSLIRRKEDGCTK